MFKNKTIKPVAALLSLVFLFTSASCGMRVKEAVVIYDASKDDGLVQQAAAETTPVQRDIPIEEPSSEEADAQPGTPSATELPSAEPSAVNETGSGENTGENPSASPEATRDVPSDLLISVTELPGRDAAGSDWEVISPPEVVARSDVVAQPEVVVQPEAVHDLSALSNDSLNWYYNRSDVPHEPPGAPREVDLSPFDALYLGDASQKTVYLTFDAGYEFGLTGQILDILKEKNVPAAFFMTQDYIRTAPELSQRIAAEGHVAGNHSYSHPNLPTLTDEEVAAELNDTAQFFADTTGYPMDPFFRPPAGVYSERTLALTDRLGYTTVFWSFAHVDWLTEEQPPAEVTYERVINGAHNGMIILLHAVSASNTEALPDIIDGIRAEGYEFGSLYDFRE